MRSRAWLIVVLTGLLLVPVSAFGFAGPPKAELRGNGQSERLEAWTYSWSSPSGEKLCQATHADGFPRYRTKLTVEHNHARPRVVFLRDHRPRVRSFRAHARLDELGQTVGDGRRVPFAVRPRERGGEVVAWVVPFRVNVARRPYFDLNVRFPGRGDCNEGGEASYAFAIRRE